MISVKPTTIALVAAVCLFPLCAAVTLRYSVSCPGGFNELRCPEGYEIYVGNDAESAGTPNSANCAHTNMPVLDTEGRTCQEYAVPFYAALNCDGWNSCILERPSSDWLKCPVDSFIQISYECQEQRPDLKTIVACAGTTAKLSCDDGLIQLYKYHYGRRDRNTCTSEPVNISTCFDYTSDNKLLAKCQRMEECELLVGPDLSEVVCGEAPYYLTVSYFCQGSTVEQ